jgi:uncharacterized protein (DUF934 family)
MVWNLLVNQILSHHKPCSILSQHEVHYHVPLKDWLANAKQAKAGSALKRLFTGLNPAQQLSQLDNAFHAWKTMGTPAV